MPVGALTWPQDARDSSLESAGPPQALNQLILFPLAVCATISESRPRFVGIDDANPRLDRSAHAVAKRAIVGFQVLLIRSISFSTAPAASSAEASSASAKLLLI